VTESGSRALTLKIPGSTSNLGPGLDTLALALKIYSYVTVHIADKSAIPAPKVNVTGSGAESSRQSDQGDLTYKLLTTLLKDNSLDWVHRRQRFWARFGRRRCCRI
jgi:homoserine kinase